MNLSKIISKDNLPNYAQWEPPNIEGGSFSPPPEKQTAQSSKLNPKPSKQELKFEPSKPADARPPSAKEINGIGSLPTLEEIETIQREAQEEGFAAGYQEGRKEGREQGFKKGHQEGQEAGYRKGFEEGISAGQQEILQRVQKLEQVIHLLSSPLKDLDSTVEEELAYLATAIAQQLVRRELKTAPGEIIAVVREAVSLLPVATPGVRLHLHPEDATFVRETLSLHEEASSWRIIEDPTLTRGGCLINTDQSHIDATLEKRLGTVIAAVLGDERKTDDE